MMSVFFDWETSTPDYLALYSTVQSWHRNQNGTLTFVSAAERASNLYKAWNVRNYIHTYTYLQQPAAAKAIALSRPIAEHTRPSYFW